VNTKFPISGNSRQSQCWAKWDDLFPLTPALSLRERERAALGQLERASAGHPLPEPRSADFQSAVSPISNRQGNESCGLRCSHAPQAGSPAIQQIGNLRYEVHGKEALLRNCAPQEEVPPQNGIRLSSDLVEFSMDEVPPCVSCVKVNRSTYRQTSSP